MAALIALSPSLAFGWGDGGHEIVAAIAYTRLNDKAKTEVDRLLAVPVTPAGRPKPSDSAKRFMYAASTTWQQTMFNYTHQLYTLHSSSKLNG